MIREGNLYYLWHDPNFCCVVSHDLIWLLIMCSVYQLLGIH